MTDPLLADAHRLITQMLAGEEFIAQADVGDYLRGRKALREQAQAWCERYDEQRREREG